MYGINSNLIFNDTEAISMRIKLIFYCKCEEYNQIINFKSRFYLSILNITIIFI